MSRWLPRSAPSRDGFVPGSPGRDRNPDRRAIRLAEPAPELDLGRISIPATARPDC
jgi:hypothetical protein